MREYEKTQRRKALLKTVVSCTGWGLLGYLVMTTCEGLFWLGWVALAAALCIGAYSVDKFMDGGRRCF